MQQRLLAYLPLMTIETSHNSEYVFIISIIECEGWWKIKQASFPRKAVLTWVESCSTKSESYWPLQGTR